MKKIALFIAVFMLSAHAFAKDCGNRVGGPLIQTTVAGTDSGNSLIKARH